jgi:FtsZ-binding cell division protein ZapB
MPGVLLLSKWQQLELFFFEGDKNMNETVEFDQFQLLEDKIDALILLIAELRKENGVLTEKIKVQDKEISELTQQVEGLKTTRDKAKERVISLLEKIKEVDV